MTLHEKTMVRKTKWFFILVLHLFTITASLSIPTSPYTIIAADEATDNNLPEINRRGYAGEDFYQKASKSIPRMGRRANLDPLANCKSCSIPSADESNDIINEFVKDDAKGILKIKSKRYHTIPTEVSAWPWFRDHIPDITKRNEIADNCYYMSETKNYVPSNEICYDNFICCPIATDTSILKRFLSTYSTKQTTTISPNYKANRFM